MLHNKKQRGFIEMVLVIIGFLILVGVAVFWFAAQSKNLSVPNFIESRESQATPSPASGSDASLDAELEAIEVEDPTSDLKDIDSDLNNL